ncbi:MAG TPA: hypothetical protein VMF13_19745 [Luteitalea sp.]|nr:hypothetical protein [Luteitalea sp.]
MGDDVLRLVATEAPDVVVVDLSLPGVDGRVLTKHLKSNAATADIPL